MENPNLQPSAVKRDRPEGRMPEWGLYQTKMGENKRGEMVQIGFTDAEGNTTRLQEGEKFEINRHENGDRTAVVRHPDGTMTIVKKWSLDDKYKV